MRFIRQILSLFDRRNRLTLYTLGLMLFAGAILEVFGIGIILPFVKIVGDPSIVLKHPRGGPLMLRLGIHDEHTIVLLSCIAVLLFSIVRAAYSLLTMKLSYKFTYETVRRLANELLTRYLQAPYIFHLHQNTAELIKNITFETEAVGGLLKFVMFLPTEVIIAAGLLVTLLVTEPTATLIGISLIGVFALTVYGAARKNLVRLGAIRVEEQTKMVQCVTQSLAAIKEIKLLNRGEYFVNQLSARGEKYTGALHRSTLLTQSPRVLLETAASVGIVLFVIAALVQGRDFRLLAGSLALFGLATVRLVPSATRIGNALHTIQFYTPALHSIIKGLTIQTENCSTKLSLKRVSFRNSIEYDDVTFKYPEAKIDSVSSINLQIKFGQRIAFIGKSGSGKTTLANLLLGLLKPTKGSILVDGVDIQENLISWQKHIGYIPQEIYLTDDTIRRNVAFGVPDEVIDDTAIWRSLEAAQIANFIKDLDSELDTVVGERGVRISAGQRQRIGIARALYHDSDVLVFDEATSALDNETEVQFSKAVDMLPRTKTILIIAHRLATVQNCDGVYCVEKGKIKLMANPKGILYPEGAKSFVGTPD